MKNTKPFDLESAKAGHPLTTNDGRSVEFIGSFSECGTSQGIAVVSTNRTIKELTVCTMEGALIFTWKGKEVYEERGIKLLLDTSKPWEAPLKQGDIVQLKSNGKWVDTIFISHLPNSGAILLDDDECSIGNYPNKTNWDSDDFVFYEKIEKGGWRRKPTESNIEITVKVNGVDSKLSDISKETLLKIRENN